MILMSVNLLFQIFFKTYPKITKEGFLLRPSGEVAQNVHAGVEKRKKVRKIKKYF